MWTQRIALLDLRFVDRNGFGLSVNTKKPTQPAGMHSKLVGLRASKGRWIVVVVTEVHTSSHIPKLEPQSLPVKNQTGFFHCLMNLRTKLAATAHPAEMVAAHTPKSVPEIHSLP